ncbi:hypothetical protein GBA52_028475 [Prunus armeniaca]|nr:hypothetical protein GBA52_028475 [Prunus armeniaca]
MPVLIRKLIVKNESSFGPRIIFRHLSSCDFLSRQKKAVEPEADPERDQRTVFAYQMPLKATERDVYEFFSKAGKVRDVRLIMDRNSRRSKGVGFLNHLVQWNSQATSLDLETGQCKGFGFVQFAHLEHAKAAQSLNGKLEIAGRTIKVSSVTDHVGSQETGAKSADFDDDDGGGLSLNAQSRALLMQKLDRTGIATRFYCGSLGVPVLNGSAPNQRAGTLPINGQAAVSAPILPLQLCRFAVTEPIGNPSECLLLKNMFDPATEREPDFDIDIKDDVEEECSKCGRVKHIYVDKLRPKLPTNQTLPVWENWKLKLTEEVSTKLPQPDSIRVGCSVSGLCLSVEALKKQHNPQEDYSTWK